MGDFLEIQRCLIKMEHDWEWEENSKSLQTSTHSRLQREGTALLSLRVTRSFVSLGRLMLELESACRPTLTVTRIKTGDVFGILESSAKQTEPYRGTVVKFTRDKKAVIVSLSQEHELSTSGTFKLILMPNEVTFKRLDQCIDRMHEYIANDPTCIEHCLPDRILQQDRPVAFIHGPPGTGKSTTLIEIILQLSMESNPSLLVCGPSNVSVDNLVERMESWNQQGEIKLIRVGDPPRMLEGSIKHSLDASLRQDDQWEIIKDLRRKIDSLVSKLFIKKEKVANKRESLKILGDLRKDLKEREKRSLQTVLGSSQERQIVFSTLINASSRVLDGYSFDYVIIDESTQALEIECWIAMMKEKKGVILAGDPRQLPPTVTCPEAVTKGLERTLMDRAEATCPHLIHMLSIQYRINSAIMEFPSREFYSSQLECAIQVANISIDDLIPDNIEFSSLLWIDTQYSANPHESRALTVDGTEEHSKSNEYECTLGLSI